MDYMREFIELTEEQAKTFIRDSGSTNWPLRQEVRTKIPKHPKSVLDLGCGNGNDALKYEAESYIGIDISPSLIKAAREYAPKHKFLIGDASSLPFEDDSFEYAFCVSLLEHLHSLEDTRDILREMLRVTSQKVVISWHNPPLGDEPTKIIPSTDQTGMHFGYKKWSNYLNIFDLTKSIIDKNKIHTTVYNKKAAIWEIDLNV